MRKSKNDDSLRIVNQYRDREKHGMVYELRRGEDRLALLAAPSEGAGAQEWRFEARTAQSPELVVTGEWGRTRAEALETVGRSWSSQVDLLGIPRLDWLAGATALVAVKAV